MRERVPSLREQWESKSRLLELQTKVRKGSSTTVYDTLFYELPHCISEQPYHHSLIADIARDGIDTLFRERLADGRFPDANPYCDTFTIYLFLEAMEKIHGVKPQELKNECLFLLSKLVAHEPLVPLLQVLPAPELLSITRLLFTYHAVPTTDAKIGALNTIPQGVQEELLNLIMSDEHRRLQLQLICLQNDMRTLLSSEQLQGLGIQDEAKLQPYTVQTVPSSRAGAEGDLCHNAESRVLYSLADTVFSTVSDTNNELVMIVKYLGVMCGFSTRSVFTREGRVLLKGMFWRINSLYSRVKQQKKFTRVVPLDCVISPIRAYDSFEPLDEVIHEIKAYLEKNTYSKYITLPFSSLVGRRYHSINEYSVDAYNRNRIQDLRKYLAKN